jgi:hypothetical protein
MRSPWLKRLVGAWRDLTHFPAFLRMAVELVEAADEVARQDFFAAERRLLRICGAAPSGTVERSTTLLLMALL